MARSSPKMAVSVSTSAAAVEKREAFHQRLKTHLFRVHLDTPLAQSFDVCTSWQLTYALIPCLYVLALNVRTYCMLSDLAHKKVLVSHLILNISVVNWEWVNLAIVTCFFKPPYCTDRDVWLFLLCRTNVPSSLHLGGHAHL